MNLQTLGLFISETPNPITLLSTGRHLFWPSSHISERREISYGLKERQKLDIYEPAEVDDDTEMIVFFYGGGWETGSKDIHRFVGRSWAEHDYIVALPNYRLAPEATYPDQMEDVTKSLDWIRKKYENFPGSIYLAGHSAGAQLAALAGFSEKWRKDAELTNEEIEGFILLAGVYQFYPYEKADIRVRRFLGKEKYWKEAQPFNSISNSLSPVFLAHGQTDTEVLPEQSIQLHQSLTDLNVKNELLLEDGLGHIELLLNTTRKSSNFWNHLQRFF